MKAFVFYLFLTIGLLIYTSNTMQAQINGGRKQGLDAKQQHIVTIATFTAKGDLPQLNQTLHKALDAGLTINEAKEVLVHLYAYCGFPRSLQGINTLMAVVDARKAKGIIDKVGKEATPVSDSGSKYERGKKVLESLTGRPETSPKTGYAAFSPEIEVFLKEHLFADLFERDILSYAEREMATIAALINLGGLEPMMQSHMGIALNIGITEAGLMQIISLIEAHGGKKEAEVGRQVLAVVINSRKK